MMKDETEIQRAHDLIHGFVRIAESMDIDKGEMGFILSSLDVLCWALDHSNNQNFTQNLLRLEAFLFGKGFEFVDTGGLHSPNGDQEQEG
jgi:hypothetical protein